MTVGVEPEREWQAVTRRSESHSYRGIGEGTLDDPGLTLILYTWLSCSSSLSCDALCRGGSASPPQRLELGGDAQSYVVSEPVLVFRPRR